VALEAGFASNVVGLPISTSFQVRRCFSNKAFNITEISTDVKVLGLAKLLWYLKCININRRRFYPSIGESDFE
jgi:electron transfer flavoprotein alpha subunit